MVLTLLCVAFLLFLRRSDFFVRPQFWAEDAEILYRGARDSGWKCLFAPYPSYYIVAQRLVACLAIYLPAVCAPWAYCYAALAYTLLTAWYCLRARLDDLVDRRGRIALALALVLVPHTGEVFMKLIGAQWMLMPILLLLIVQDQPSRRKQAIADFAGLCFVGLTGPFIVLYAPWFLVRLRKVTGGCSRYNLLLIAVAWTLAAVQTQSVRHGPPLPHPVPTLDPHQWVHELGCLLPGGLFFGNVVPTMLGKAFYVIDPALLLLLARALWRGERKRRWVILALLGSGLTAYAGGVRTEAANLLGGLHPFGGGARYFFPFYLFSMWSAIVLCFDASKQIRTVAGVALAMMLLAAASHFTEAVAPNDHWAKYAQALDAGEAVYGIPILPDWHLDFPATKPPPPGEQPRVPR